MIDFLTVILYKHSFIITTLSQFKKKKYLRVYSKIYLLPKNVQIFSDIQREFFNFTFIKFCRFQCSVNHRVHNCTMIDISFIFGRERERLNTGNINDKRINSSRTPRAIFVVSMQLHLTDALSAARGSGKRRSVAYTTRPERCPQDKQAGFVLRL